ncbi:MAG: MFS transporter [Dehalococcoidia bacterium]|nr:MFS transporter [Dehalococcoidia bacterium]
MFDALKYKDFQWIWLSQTAHAFALWAQMVALPLLVLEITDNSAAQLGGVIAVRTVPTLLVGPWAGVVADWFDRRAILIATKWANLALSIAIALLVASGRVELSHVYLWMFLRGATQVFDQPARYSMIPSILPGNLVTQGMALLSSTQNFMRIAGATGAGFIAEYLGLGWTFSIIAVAAVAGLLTTYQIHTASNERAGKSGFRGMTSGLIEGAKYSTENKTIRGVLIASLVYFTFGMSFMQVFAPLFAVQILEIGRDGLGIMFALTGSGALVASLVIARTNPSRLGLVLPVTVIAVGATLALFSLATYLPRPLGLFLPMALVTVVGAFQTSFMALSRSVMVQSSPQDMRGRVLAFISMDRAMMAAGGALGGVLSAVYGAQPVQIVFGAVCATGGLIVLLSLRDLRTFRTVEKPEEPETPRAVPAGRPG